MDVFLMLVAVLAAGMAIGFAMGVQEGKQSGSECEVYNTRLARVVQELQSEVNTLQHEVDATKGLWATDRPNLITNSRLKSIFYRIGYPKDKL